MIEDDMEDSNSFMPINKMEAIWKKLDLQAVSYFILELKDPSQEQKW